MRGDALERIAQLDAIGPDAIGTREFMADLKRTLAPPDYKALMTCLRQAYEVKVGHAWAGSGDNELEVDETGERIKSVVRVYASRTGAVFEPTDMVREGRTHTPDRHTAKR